MTARLTGAACRAGRAILKWSTRDLAQEADISPATVNLLEADRPYRAGTAERIIEAFALHGVEITNGTGTGARLAFVEIRPHEAEPGDWRVLMNLRAGDPLKLIYADRAALEADSDGTPPPVSQALRKAIDDIYSNLGIPLPQALLPSLRTTWRIVPISHSYTVNPSPPTSEPPRYFASIGDAERFLGSVGTQSLINPAVWIEPHAAALAPNFLSADGRQTSVPSGPRAR